MRRATPLLLAACGAVVIAAAAGVVANRRQRAAEVSPLPSVENGGPRGLAAARAWLAATGRPHRTIRPGDPGPEPREVLLLLAPPVELEESDADALLAHAERGGVVVWALGSRAQRPLERRLGISRARGPSDAVTRVVTPLLPHPLFDGLALRTGGALLRATEGVALPLAASAGGIAAAAAPRGRGEVVALAAPDPLENLRLGDGENLSLLARLSALGPIAFDERHLARPRDARPGAALAAVALALQALLAAGALLLALGRRLGAVRVDVESGARRTARDYLSSLAELYRRAGGEAELRSAAWRSLRRGLERRAGIPSRLPDAEAARRLATRSPAAAAPFARALAARAAPAGEAGLVALVRAAAETEAALARTGPGGPPRPR
jgi:hypothetical protein